MNQNDEPLEEQQSSDAAPAQPSFLRKTTSFLASKLMNPRQTGEDIQEWMKSRYGAKTAAQAMAIGQLTTWGPSPAAMALLGVPLPFGTGVLTGIAAAETLRQLKSKRTLVKERRQSREEEAAEREVMERLKSLPGYGDYQHKAEGGEVTKTENFKRWFGDWEQPEPQKGALQSLLDFVRGQFSAKPSIAPASVVRDESGIPKAVYHGTMAQFDAFSNAKTNKNSLFGPGHYFTENQDVAEGYMGGNALREHREDEDRSSPRLIKAYLNIRNPFDADAYLKRMAAAPGIAKASYEFISDAMQGNAAATEKLKALGYDGITHTGREITKGTKHKVWVAFEPNQIKSTENEGTFNPDDPRIHKKQGGEVPEVPGIPRGSDNTTIKADAGEYVVPNGPSQRYRQQLEDMRAGRTPHFETGGEVPARTRPVSDSEKRLLDLKKDAEAQIARFEEMGNGYEAQWYRRQLGHHENELERVRNVPMAEPAPPIARHAPPMATAAPPIAKAAPPAGTAPSSSAPGSAPGPTDDWKITGEHPWLSATGGFNPGPIWEKLKKEASNAFDWSKHQELHQKVYGENFRGAGGSGDSDSSSAASGDLKELTKAIRDLIEQMKTGGKKDQFTPTLANALAGMGGPGGAGAGGQQGSQIDWMAIARMAAMAA